MAYQTAANVKVVLHRETSIGVTATATGATQMRIVDSPGLELKRAQIQSTEKRSDGTTPMMRIGGKTVDGSYNTELSVGGAHDILLEALMRSTWATSTSIGFATMTTVAFGTNYLTAAGGDFVGGQGLRVGDIFTVANSPTAGNNGKNTPIVAITSLTITVPDGTFATQTATATGTLTRLGKVITATTPTRYSHTIEQYDSDIDLSELFLGCRCVGVKLSFKPGAMATAQYTFMGLDRTKLDTGTSPYFTSPTVTTGLALIADDSGIRYNGSAVSTFTGFDLDFQITAKGEPVIGSFVSPDIFDNNIAVTGSITGLRSDFSNLTPFDAETEFSVSILLQEPTGSPPGCLALYLPRVKISALSAPVGGGDGAKIETLTVSAAVKNAATGYDQTVALISSSAQ